MSTRRFHSSDLAGLRGALGIDDSPARTLVLAAHPDDEVVGAGGQLIRLGAGAIVVHVTDGASPDPADARTAGFDSAEAYARARRDEALRALALAGVPASHSWSLGLGGQRASFSLAALARTIATTIEETSPALILTHPYEGGHPDHDATAFAAAAACRLLERGRVETPMFAEFTSYHRGAAGIQSGRFLQQTAADVEVPLTEPMQAVKRSMIESFATQQRVLAQFEVGGSERFRLAPAYDFTMPPHDGRLYYEGFSWGLDGVKWRALARAALAELS